MMNQESKRPVVLEDLLRLKRAERPSVEFWAQFDRELRAKQLAALVEKRPWWKALPRALAGFSRYHLPLGATAVLALTIISVREFHPAPHAPAKSGAVKSEATVAVAPSSQEAAPAAIIGGGAVTIDSVAAVDERLETPSSLALLNDNSAAAVESAEAFVAETPLLESASTGRQLTSNGHSLGSSLVALRGAEATFARDVLGSPRGSETRLVASSKSRVDPLAQMTPPTEARRSSLFNASFARSYAPVVREASSRATARLSDEQFYDTVSRFVARGNSLGAKF